MAGTLVADTLQDGAGNSTAMDNAIYGSAKAWLNYNGSTTTIRASYNVSSVTRNSAGNYTVNMTTALSDTNYVVNVTADSASSGYIGTFNGNVTKTTSVFGVTSYNVSGSGSDTATINVSVFR